MRRFAFTVALSLAAIYAFVRILPVVDARYDWPEFLFWTIPSDIVTMMLTVVVIVVTIWGITLIRDATPLPGDDADEREKHDARFTFWLGLFMLFDASLYGLLLYSLLRGDDSENDLWLVLYFLPGSITVIFAFYHWARGRRIRGEMSS